MALMLYSETKPTATQCSMALSLIVIVAFRVRWGSLLLVLLCPRLMVNIIKHLVHIKCIRNRGFSWLF